MMKKVKGILSITISLLMMVLILNTGYAQTNNSMKDNVVDTITINAENCTMEVQKSDNNNFEYDYETQLFDVRSKITKNEVLITAKSKKNVQTTMSDKIIVYIPNNVKYKKINVKNHKAGIFLCEIDAEINIDNNEGSVSFCIPKQISNNITYTSTKGSGAATFCKEANNYSFNLAKQKSSASIPFEKYNPNSSTYKYVKGNGFAKINVNLKSSAFSLKLIN